MTLYIKAYMLAFPGRLSKNWWWDTKFWLGHVPLIDKKIKSSDTLSECEWRWIWIEMILWLCGINVFFFSFHKQLKSVVPNPEMCKMRQKIIASMP